MAVNAGRVEVTLGANVEQFQRAFRAAASQLDRFGARLQSIGSAITTRFTLPFALAGTAVARTAAKFDEEMTKIETLVGVGREQVDAWRQSLLALGPALGKTPVELAQALFAVTSAGARGATALEILTKAGKASALGLGETRQIALAVTAAMQAYQKEGLSAADATDVLVGTVREGNLEAESLAGAFGKVLGVANELGVGMTELGAFIATVSRVGQDTAVASTSLRSVLSTLLGPTQQTREAFERLGLDLNAVRAQLGERGGLISVLRLMVDATEGSTDEIKELFPNIRALTGVLNAAGSQGESFAAIYQSIADTVGTATEEGFTRAAQEAAFQFRQFRASVQAAAVRIGRILMPFAMQFLGVVHRLVNAFSFLNPELQRSIILYGGIVAAGGPLLTLYGGLFRIVGLLVGVVGNLGTNLLGVARLALTFVNPWVAAFALLFLLWDDFRNIVLQVFQAQFNASKRVINFLVSSFVFVGKVAKLVWDEFVKQPFLDAMEFIRTKAQQVFGALANALTLMGHIARDAARMIRGFFEEAAEGSEEEGATLGSRVARAALDAFGRDYVGEFINIVAGAVRRAQAAIQRALETVRDLAQNAGGFGEELRALEEEAQRLGNLKIESPDTSEITDGFKQKFITELKEIGVSAGADLVRGIVEGGLSVMDMIKNVLVMAIQAAVTIGLRSLFGIASPSKVMMEMGAQLVEGLALGIEGHRMRLAQASASMAAIPMAAAGPVFNINADFSRIPQPMTPREAALSAEFQSVFRETFRELEAAGFRVRR